MGSAGTEPDRGVPNHQDPAPHTRRTPFDRRGLRDRIGTVTLADEHTLRRRLDKLGRSPAADKIAGLERAVTAAEKRIAARRAAVPVLEFPPELPVSDAREEIAAAIAAHQVVVIAGETGSGKTTQLPKICLELGRGVRGAIGHTQPRRIAASSVARRIAEETHTDIGDAIGYSVRFSDRSGADTLVKVMTDGILLREIASDPMLRHYDTLIIDEAHERSLNIDFILGYLHRLLPRRPDLKVIITSATIEPDRFARHFTTATTQVPVLEVSGRTYPVEVRYRPLSLRDGADSGSEEGGGEHADLDLFQGIDAAIGELWGAHGRGDILVFLPTERDIREAAATLSRRVAAGAEVVPLYARLSIADQHKVFAPSDGRRIVLSTNVAETSLTVPGIRYVIDSGTARISRYATRTKVLRLPVEPVSQASARQRAGRCGRVAPGVCIRLYSETDFDSRPAFTDPEILRANLASVILQMASLRLGDVAEFPFVQPPDARSVRDGMAVLTELGAIVPAGKTPGDDKGTGDGKGPEDGKRSGDDRSTRDGTDTGEESRGPRLTKVGRSMARIPVDPRIARMLVGAHEEGCLDHVLVIAAALSIPDVRERPAEHREAADASHRRFVVPGSDFLGYLALWRHLTEQRKQLSGNQFRRTCEREFLHYLRIREWQDLHRQLRGIVDDLGWGIPETEQNPDAIHRAILAGLLGNIAARNTEGREFTGARNTTLLIFPGSPLSKKPPAFMMAAEIIETSRLFAHTVASIDPLWAERLAGDLVKRTYSEPHWSNKRGAAMAYERVTLYGVPLVAKRRVDYGPVDPVTARDLFLRHALVEGDWHTDHAFFQRNRALLEEAADVEHRARRRDVVISEDQLFEFYDQRVPAEVTSARHFDSWWKTARRATPELLDLTPEDVAADIAVADTDYPGIWAQGDTRLELRYRFEPGAADDGVTVVIPAPLLPHIRNAGFDWLVPGMREELATELVKTLPKQLRKTMAPAQRFASLALSRLKPRSEPLTRGLARELAEITRHRVRPEDFDTDRIPAHLRMHFALADPAGKITARADSLAELSGATASPAATSSTARHTRWTADGIGTLAASETVRVAGQQLTRYPTLRVVGDPGSPDGVEVTTAASSDEAARLHLPAVIVLLDAAIAPLSAKASSGLDPAGRLALSQNPYRESAQLFADCTRRAIRDLVPADAALAVRDPAAFEKLVSGLRSQVIAAAPDYLRLAVDALREVAPLRREMDTHSGQVPADDVAEQLENLIFDGFVLATPRTHLEDLPRYLAAARSRLEQLPGSATRDHDAMASVDRVIARWNQRLDQVPAPRRDRVNEQAHWMVEELRVGLFAQRLGTRYPVSEKRALRTLDRLG
ncbi:ATP-dependent RNA helicase HrpA [Gordonia sp. NB41Y]|uniref:ATP-dependent RNA helicase HrpA n=1 Tax=Gordonia sp. NB41Y TaxID=875808 RepID=UPI00273B26D2|nr:ATP-dependent RNA helicase HrpA [Gordonia sp. NB41Y]WLP91095.1 ATP-dependent RNA helicase HrpA [Gordonia sp. NB41Y]